MGMDRKNIVIVENGASFEITGKSIKKAANVPAGQVFVDGLGVGDVGSIVIRDRKHLAEDGIIIVVAAIDSASHMLISGPDVVSRGFVFVREAEELMEEARMTATNTITRCFDRNIREWGTIKSRIRDDVSKLMYERTKRSPMILPILMEI